MSKNVLKKTAEYTGIINTAVGELTFVNGICKDATPDQQNFMVKNFKGYEAVDAKSVGVKVTETNEEKINRDAEELKTKEAKENQKKIELDQKYFELIQEGDAHFEKQEFEYAKAKYSDASTLKPDEDYPKTKITEIDDLLERMVKAEQDEINYNNLVQEGKDLFDSGEYEVSKSKYSEALELKPDEQTLKEAIEAIDVKLQELADKKEEDAQKQAALLNDESDFKVIQKFVKDFGVKSKVKTKAALLVAIKTKYPDKSED